MSSVISHNPTCGPSCSALAILRRAGADPVFIDYLAKGWVRPQLLGLFDAAGLTPRDALRPHGAPVEEMGLTSPNFTNEALIAAIIAHPTLVNRTIVCTAHGVRRCRPSEAVLDHLPPGPRAKGGRAP